ncbi:TIGR02444 family protein [Legionella jamestowniensis]|uniref:TIGR02444 family protein n=1 Tax=Legionella jamestowniensis TaxID=455 RepID=A0A0W0UKK2_9GAMM|nr:TIGR02444 family protein [Legionella jamestowniensis]KTD08057.1 hypothetical protein Ljam_2252 [Legionella jamestowniensis]OCH97338.1 TIGR02444 family protein [Legionella jamestowniensis]SFM05893.1 TIGR02444 family protein [Legionella jamestowniensis DSM 19215]
MTYDKPPSDLPTEKNNPFWQFSLKVYQHPDIKKYCLLLQNSKGVNINLLLFCCWLSYLEEPITYTEFKKASVAIKEWDQEVTKSLRHARQYIKTHCHSSMLDHFYKQVLTQEINSEAYQQHLLYSHFSKRVVTHKKDKVTAMRYLYWLFNDMGIVINNELGSLLENFILLTLEIT